jgi:hypothetical protein
MRTSDIALETINWSMAFSEHQLPDGSVSPYSDVNRVARTALEKLTDSYQLLCHGLGGSALESFGAYQQDVDEWLGRGLENPPNFRATHDTWRPSADPEELVPFLAPIRIPNGVRGGSFIMNLAVASHHGSQHQEVVAQATAELETTKAVAVIEAPYRTLGFSGGDGSVVFSELMASDKRRGPQAFGAFITTDFPHRFASQSMNAPIAKGSRLVSMLNQENSMDLSEERGVWLQVHDCFHDLGALPHTEHLPAKMHFPTAMLDELKADSAAYLAMGSIDDEWRSVAHRHMLDKMFRFPFSSYAYMSVDGAVGEFFFREVRRAGGLYRDRAGNLELDEPAMKACLATLLEDILAIEDEGHDNTERYIDLATEYLNRKGIALPPNRQPLNWRQV